MDISKCYCTIFYNLDKIFNLKNFNMSYDEYLNMIENIFDVIKNKYKIELRDTKVIFYGSLNKKLQSKRKKKIVSLKSTRCFHYC